METKEKSLEEQLAEAIEKTNFFKEQNGRINEWTYWNNKIYDLQDAIKTRDGHLKFKERQKEMAKEVERAEAERLKNPAPPPTEEGELIPIVATPNRRLLVKWDKHKGIPISYWVRILKPQTTLTFDVYPHTQGFAFEKALACWLQGNG